MLSPSRMKAFLEISLISAFATIFLVKFPKFGKFPKYLLLVPVIPVFVILFLLPFFNFFLVSLKLPELHEPIRHRIGSHLCFLLCDGKSLETK